MKVLSLLAGAAFAATAAAQCEPQVCAIGTSAGDTPKTCDVLVGDLGMTCAELSTTYGCDCAGCICAEDTAGGITDAPDDIVTVEGGGPGGGGDGDGNNGEQTAPPPPGDATHTEPPIVTRNDPTAPIANTGAPPPTVPDDDGNGNTVDPNAGFTVITGTPPDRTTTTKTTATPFHTDGTHTLPPVEITTTTYISTSHRTRYECLGDCAVADFKGDGFCDDDNNKCNCDWDGGDCCGTDNLYIYCTHCKCHDPAYEGIYNCPGDCADDAQYGDGYCDDGNNICACNWDGGDCCGSQNHYGFCTECQCIDPTHTDSEDPACNGNCGSANYIGDGFCDDNNNNCGCDWDNGDCCGPTNSYAHCDDCFCLDPDNSFHLDPDNEPGFCVTPCDNQGFFADGFCDDENNVCGCDWDGGDCCGGQNSYIYCSECTCLDPLYSWGYNCPDSQCENDDWAGDAYCDDGNNNCGCNWDGGDCCGAEHFYTYCDTCACLDPGYNGEVICSGKCETSGWKGDGYCDDGNNVCGCDWDGGDCCDHNAKLTHCTECECLNPNYVDDGCTTPCEVAQWAGDGHCDDGNNVCGCDWDNGDCCGTGSSTQYAYCQECRCQDPDSSYYTDADEECTGTCYHADWAGDTYCDDGNNNCGCNWDGGDCCGSSNHHTYCTKCACSDPDFSDIATCTGTCAHSGWTGDNYCDDGNNNCGCDWDGGDCCGEGNSLAQCTLCKCQDPAVVDFTTKQPAEVGATGGHTTEYITDPVANTPPVETPAGNGNTAPPDAHN